MDDELIGTERPAAQRFNLGNSVLVIDPTSEGRQAQGLCEEEQGVAPEVGIHNDK